MRTRTSESRANTVLTRTALVGMTLALLPYLVFKALWLSGSRLGMETEGAATMMTTRMEVGNIVTIVMAVMGIGFGFWLARHGEPRVPAWLVILVGGGATGLLAPIVLALPAGALAQMLLTGQVTTGGEGGLSTGVFGIVYGGFAVFGVCLAALLGVHAVTRWAHEFTTPPRLPGGPWTRIALSAGVLPFSAALLWWALAGPGELGPAGMEVLSQRAVLGAVGILALLAAVVPHLPRTVSPRRARLRWLLLWTTCWSTAAQGPALLLLDRDAAPSTLLCVLALTGSAAALALGSTALHASRAQHAEATT